MGQPDPAPPHAGPDFEFDGPDALNRVVGGFVVGIVAGQAILLGVPAAWWVPLAGIGAIAVAGLRAGVSVTHDRIVVTKSCWRWVYARYAATHVRDVTYGGDWGLTEGSLGVVVDLGDVEVHVGSPGTQAALYEALSRRRARAAVPATTRTPDAPPPDP